MITGTNHFISIDAAEKYYYGFYGPDVLSFVKTKIKNKEITIGPPQIKQGEKLLTNTAEGRYFIES